jgi:LCP family protein required for cell wall assembly
VANVSSSATKKINTIYSSKRAAYRSEKDGKVRSTKAMEDTVDSFADVLGFKVDYWFLVDMDAFITLVNAVGGVEYTVGTNISHPEFSQSYTAGRTYQLNGQQALDIMRYRSYRNGDIGRINVRQDFLTVAVKQILAKKESISPVNIADIFFNHVVTDADPSYLIYFAREFFRMDSENVNFYIMPGFYNDSYDGKSYVTIHVDDWLDMVNEKLNPFYKRFKPTDVSILTRGSDRRFYVTDGNIQGDPSWGGGIKTDGSGSYGKSDSGSLPTSNPSTAAPSTSPTDPTDTDIPTDTDLPPTDTDLPPTDTDVPPTDTDAPPTDTDAPTPTSSDNPPQDP